MNQAIPGKLIMIQIARESPSLQEQEQKYINE